MSELTTGGINFGYQSPISQIYKDVEYKFKEDMENKIIEAVHHFGISVDKEELIKALQYDRNQYDKGYSDGGIKELERIKQEVIQKSDWSFIFELYGSCTEIKGKILCYLDNRISELKGENNNA